MSPFFPSFLDFGPLSPFFSQYFTNLCVCVGGGGWVCVKRGTLHSLPLCWLVMFHIFSTIQLSNSVVYFSRCAWIKLRTFVGDCFPSWVSSSCPSPSLDDNSSMKASDSLWRRRLCIRKVTRKAHFYRHQNWSLLCLLLFIRYSLPDGFFPIAIHIRKYLGPHLQFDHTCYRIISHSWLNTDFLLNFFGKLYLD